MSGERGDRVQGVAARGLQHHGETIASQEGKDALRGVGGRKHFFRGPLQLGHQFGQARQREFLAGVGVPAQPRHDLVRAARDCEKGEPAVAIG